MSAMKFKRGDKVIVSKHGKVSCVAYPRFKELYGRILTVMLIDPDGFVHIQEEYDKYMDDAGWEESNFDFAPNAAPVAQTCKCNTRDLMAYGCPSAKGKPCRNEVWVPLTPGTVHGGLP